MSKSIVIAEKPSVGRDIARVLGCTKNKGYFENGQYIVTWALGHLVSLAAPEKYKKDFLEWKMETLPMLPNPFKLEILKPTTKQYFLVKTLLERKDVSQVIIATDAGREGELVARWTLDFANCKKPIKRLWISSVTDKAIKDGFKNLVDGRKYDNLYFAARARAKADWIVGINGTRALTCKYNASLSMGRVQTPTVGLVASRDQAIRAFKPVTYYHISGDVDGFKMKWFKKTGKGTLDRISQREDAEKILKETKGRGKVTAYNEKSKKVYAKGLYDLTELQRDANKAYGFSAKETLNIMQGLYERHKVLTYPRTDSKYLTKDIIPTIKDRVRACRLSGEKEDISYILKSNIVGHKSFVDDAKVGDHHAIIPTEQSPIYQDFSNKEQKIYNMVVKRFLAVLMPPKEVLDISLEVQVGQHFFKGKQQIELVSGSNGTTSNQGPTTSNQGAKASDHRPKASNHGSNKNINSSKLTIGSQVELRGAKIDRLLTEAPKHLSEGDLLHEMEKVGLGTVATRPDIIEKIINNQYVDLTNNQLKMTKTGRQLLDLVPQSIRTSELTAKWEKDLEKISKGQLKEEVFLKEMTQFTQDIVREIKMSQGNFKHENVSSEKCPGCGQKLLIHKGKHGKRLVCPDRNCGYRKNLSKLTNARCPECHIKMELVGEGDNKTFVCKCGHKEKMSAFNKRKESKGKQMSKRDVQRYMNKSNKKEESVNNPFANLLGDLKDED